MSEIANALKKIKNERKKVVFSHQATSKIASLSLNKIYIIIAIAMLSLITIYFLFKTPVLNKLLKDPISIDENTAILTKKIAEYQKAKEANKYYTFYKSIINNDTTAAMNIISKIDPNDPLKSKFLGIYYFILNSPADAKPHLEKSYTLQKDNTSANLLAYIYYSYGDYVKAMNIINTLEDTNENILINKAVTFEKNGKLEEALILYKKALSLIKNDLIKYRVIIKIESIKLGLQKG
ncbi:MAG: CDC27 family protein [Calditerrivibrio sp.]|nr:CDC27 family protein [Calditerrivibrio sp.]